MREILFKAKRIDNGEWIHGDLKTIGECSITTGDGIYNEDVEPETVCQFTGLKDADGQMIFEWDEVVGTWRGLPRVPLMVEFEKGAWKCNHSHLLHESEHILLTGNNIHDRKPALSAGGEK